MYSWKDFKSITTYYNALITGKKEDFDIRFTKEKDTLKTVMNFSKFNISYTIKNEEETSDEFKNIVVNYEEFYKVMKSIKGIKQIDVFVNNDKLILKTDKEETFEVNCSKMITKEFVGTHIMNIPVQEFRMAFSFNDVASKSGVFDFDENIFFYLKNNVLYMSSYNVGVYVGNKIQLMDAQNIIFKLPYSYTGFVKKWLKFVENKTQASIADDLNFSIFERFLKIEIDKYSIILPIEKDEKIGEKFMKITDFEFPNKTTIPYHLIQEKSKETLNEKEKGVDMIDFFDTQSIMHKPLLKSVVDLFDVDDFDVDVKRVDSQNLVLELDSDFKSISVKILLFGIKN